MDHQLIEDTALPERYVTGRLDEAERARFEEHLVDCPICLERIEASEGFSAGLRGASPQVRIPPSAPSFSRRRATRSTWLLASACAASLVAVVLTGVRLAGVERELSSERTTTVEAQAKLKATQQQLMREKAGRETAEARLAAPRQRTPVQIPLLALIATRGGSAPTLELPAAPGPFLLLVERENPPRFQSYLATVRSTEGVAVWQGPVRPSSRDTVAVALDSGSFPTGTYSLVLEGVGVGGRMAPVARYSFRTVTP
jgi:hypothetical protein